MTTNLYTNPLSVCDQAEIRRWYDLIGSTNQIIEVRVISPQGKTYSGYFQDVDSIINALKPYEQYGIYYTVNSVIPDCYSREQRDRIIPAKYTTTDKDIAYRSWIYIDIDTKKVTGVNANEQELALAHAKCGEVYRFLQSQGFNEPVIVMSGNGYHLYYRCNLSNDDTTTSLVKNFVCALSMLFSDNSVDIDEKVTNLSRISKLPGTFSRKGSDTPERPQRMCRIVYVPNIIEVNDVEYISKVAKLYPSEDMEKPNRDNAYNVGKFDLDAFLQRHDIKVKRIVNVTGGKKYVLEHCVFDESHTGRDAVIFQRDNGALAYVCFHNSCSHYKWKDVRLKFEPEAYDRISQEEYRHKRDYYHPKPIEILQRTDEKGDKWLNLEDIDYVDISALPHIDTGFPQLDTQMGSLLYGDVTLISGINSSGKSSFINCIAINAIAKGHKVAIWSGELQGYRLKAWINQSIAGKEHLNISHAGYYYCNKQVSDTIDAWTKDKLVLYNNNYGNKLSQLLNDMKEVVKDKGVDLIVLDNLMALDIDNGKSDKWDMQKDFIITLSDFAKENNIHIILVVHPRKTTMFLRKEDISGSSDITNLANNLLILHRVGDDFEKRATEFLGAKRVNELLQFSTVIEICKNRALGNIDKYIGLYYEQDSRRFKSEVAEHIVYPCFDQPIQKVEFDDDAFSSDNEDEDEDAPF
jgi:archaellum biogenesis ATPase FlaH